VGVIVIMFVLIGANTPTPQIPPTATLRASKDSPAVGDTLTKATASPTSYSTSPLVTSAPSQSEQTPMPNNTVVVTRVLIYFVQNANIHSGPGLSFSVIGSAKAGDFYWVVAQDNNGTWYQLKTGEWVPASAINNISVDIPVRGRTP